MFPNQLNSKPNTRKYGEACLPFGFTCTSAQVLHFGKKFILSKEKLHLSEQNSLLRAKNVLQCLLLSVNTHSNGPSRSVFAFALAQISAHPLVMCCSRSQHLFPCAFNSFCTVLFVPHNQPITDLDAKILLVSIIPECISSKTQTR